MSYIGNSGIQTHSYPVVSKINKKVVTALPTSDLSYGGFFSEAEVWDFVEQNDVSTLCLEGNKIDWNLHYDFLSLMLRECNTYEKTVDTLISLMNNLAMVRDLGGSFEGPNMEMYNHSNASGEKTLVFACLKYEMKKDADGHEHPCIFTTSEDSILPFYAGTDNVDEAYKIIKKQEELYYRFKILTDPVIKFSFNFKIDDSQDDEGRDLLEKLVERLNQK